MRASVIIVSYNSLLDLDRCLPALLPSLGSQDELVVVDNASSDGCAAWLARAYPQVRLVCSLENRGFAGGANLGALHARGRCLAFLNPDTLVEPGWLDALLAALQADPEAGMATSKILLMGDPRRINTCGNDVHISGITMCRGMGAPRDAYAEQEEVSAVSGAAFAMRRHLFERLGGFDETFFMYMEDTDLSLRLRLAGYTILYVPSSIVYHAYRLAFGPHKTYYQERNRYLMLLKNLRLRTLLALLPALLLAELVSWGFVLLNDRRSFASKLEAYLWVIRRWRWIRQASARSHSASPLPDRTLLASAAWRLDFGQAHPGSLARLARLLFDPLFFVARAPLVLLRLV